MLMKTYKDIEFKKELSERKDIIDSILVEQAPKDRCLCKEIVDAMIYSYSDGGKRLRPIFMYEIYKIFTDNISDTIKKFIASIEFIHTFSLVHDDLPAMDNDDYRHGKLATHKMYGEDMGILAGDALLNYAYEVATSSFCIKDDIDIDRKIFALRELIEATGHNGMIAGQVKDQRKLKNKEEIEDMYALKTGALIRCAFRVGAILGGADNRSLLSITSIAEKVGLAFQIQDDVLDIIGDESVIGKKVGSDAKNDKNTFANMYGVDEAKLEVEKLMNEAIKELEDMKLNTSFLASLLMFLKDREV